tara:strand:- start:3 stop:293 length:291 start_codon:yes stop_codon:yes gene_type:complete
MSLSIIGKITKIEKADYSSKWPKVVFTLETDDKYHNIFAFQISGKNRLEKFNQFQKVGDEVNVQFNVQTSEFNGKYYTNLIAWDVNAMYNYKEILK